MLASITPLGERARGQSWRRAATAYVLASTVGGAAVGTLLGGLGAALPDGWRPALATATGGLAALAAAADRAGRLPSIRRQVDEGWLIAYRDWVHGAGFGLQLGVGAVTIVTSASVYLTWALEVAAGAVAGPGGGALVGVTFGLVRALPLLSFARVTDPVRLRARHRGWQAALPAVARTTVATQAAAAVVLLTAGAVALGAGPGGLG